MSVQTWFITGTSSGFGRELAMQLLERGENVVLTARSTDAISGLAGGFPESALTLALDVTEAGQVDAAVAAALQRFGAIDVAVNNAGFGYRAAVEEGEEPEIRSMYDVNVFGLMAVTRAVLPNMRSRRQGVIVNLSSIGGRSAPAGSGYYASSKFAVEGFSDALRKEVAPLGIRVLVVEPSQFRTDFSSRSLRYSRIEISDYAETAGLRRRQDAVSTPEPGDPAKAAAAIIATVNAPHPPFRLLLGGEAVRRARLALEEQMADLMAWEQLSLDADFDE